MAAAVKVGRRGGALALLHRFVPYTHTPDDEALSSHPRTQVLDIVAAIVALCATLAYAAFTFRYLTSRPPIQEFSTFNADELAERVAVVGGRSLHLRDLAVDIVVGVQDYGQAGTTSGAALVRQTYAADGRDPPGCGPEGTCQDTYAGYVDACPDTDPVDPLAAPSWSCEHLPEALFGDSGDGGQSQIKGSCVKTQLCYIPQDATGIGTSACDASTRAPGTTHKNVMGVVVLAGATNVSSVRYWLAHTVPSLSVVGVRAELMNNGVELHEGEFKTVYLRQRLNLDGNDPNAPIRRSLVVSRSETSSLRLDRLGPSAGQVGCDVFDAPSLLRVLMESDFDVVVTTKLGWANDLVGLASGFASVALGIAGGLRAPFLPKPTRGERQFEGSNP